jgi:hypothetical protein
MFRLSQNGRINSAAPVRQWQPFAIGAESERCCEACCLKEGQNSMRVWRVICSLQA